jgi:Pyrimidine dimer DNA glycosylase
VQTFLPYKSFEKSARCLDSRRLGKQRVEAMQILNVLSGRTAAWRNHPAVLQWRGYEGALLEYTRAMVEEWRRRSYSNDKLDEFVRRMSRRKLSTVQPPWLGSRRLHDSHKSRLMQKEYSWYGEFGWTVPRDLPYYWPVTKKMVRW